MGFGVWEGLDRFLGSSADGECWDDDSFWVVVVPVPLPYTSIKRA